MQELMLVKNNEEESGLMEKRDQDNHNGSDHNNELECKLDLMDEVYPSADPWASNVWITVNRSNIYRESMRQILNADCALLTASGLNVKFMYEDGSGPGMIREFFACLAMEIFSPLKGLWEATPAATSQRTNSASLKFQPVVNADAEDEYSAPQHYRFHGRFFALALKMRIPLIWSPSLECFRHLLDESVSEQKDGKRQSALVAFKCGFSEVCDLRLLSFLSPKDLQVVMGGLAKEEIDVANWREVTHYEGFSADDMCVQWFWQYLQNADGQSRAAVLMFSTGLACLPLEGFEAIAVDDQPAFTVTKADHLPSNALPVAQVCFNQLMLPRYTSSEELENAFKIAVKYAFGFGGA